MNKNALYGILLLGLGVYFVYDTYYPQYVAWEAEITELRDKISQARATAPKLAEIRDEEVAIRERLRSSLDKLPSASELSDLLVMVIPVFERAGITSDQIATKNVGSAVEKDVYREHPIQIGGIKGLSMESIVRLLFELRTFHRIINVNSFQFNRTAPNIYDLNIDIVTYSYIAGENEDLGEAPPASSPAPAVEAPAPAESAEDTAVAPAAPPVTDTAPVADVDTAVAATGVDTTAAAGTADDSEEAAE